MKKLSRLILIISILVALSGCSEEQQKITPSGNSIKVGVIGPMSGPDKPLGLEGLQGIKTALTMIPYLDNGDDIDLVVVDDQNEPELSVKAFKKLVETDKVSAVILLSTSGSGLPVNALADSYRVPVLVLLATHSEISKNSEFVSQLCFDNSMQGKVAALFVRDELLIDTVAVFKDPDSFHSSSLANEFIRKFRSIEGMVTDVISITSDTVDFDDILPHLRAENVQLLYLPVAAKNIVAILKSLEKMAWDPKEMAGDGALATVLASYPEEIDYLEGLLAIDLYSHDLNITPYGKKVGKVFRSLYKTEGSTLSASGFEGMSLLINGLNRCNNPSDRACINRKIHSTIDFEGLMGKVTIQPNGKALRPLLVNRIRDGKLKFVLKVH